MATEQPKEPLDQKTYAHWFAITGVLLMLCTLFSLVQEFFLRRPYRGIQSEFRYVAALAVEEQLTEAKKRLEEAKAGPEYQAAVESYTKAKEAHEAPQAREAETKFKAEMDRAAADLRTVRKGLQDIRGTYQEAVYKFENHDDEAKATVLGLDPKVEKLSADMVALDARRKEFKNKISELALPVSKAADRVAAFEQEVQTLKRRIQAIDDMETEIKQIFNENLKLVDRCTTCHLGTDIPGLDGLPEKYPHFKTHPQSTDPYTGAPVDLLKIHDVAKVGCTTCHQGQGFATASAKQAHGEVEFWTTPLLRKNDKFAKGLNSAACYKCHDNSVALAGAEGLMKGKRLVKELGCWGCHKIKGIGEEEDRAAEAALDLKRLQEQLAKVQAEYDTKVAAGKKKFDDGPKRADTETLTAAKLQARQAEHRCAELKQEVRRIGPSLKTIKDKLHPGWIPIWLAGPKKWRPSTRMPNFFPERNPEFYKLETAEQIEEQQRTEIQQLTAFLWQNSEGSPAAAAEPAPSKDEVEKGKKLYETVGCRACHRLSPDEPSTPGNVYGPELSRIGEKARLSWLAKWIEYPRKLMWDAKMPSLRLTPEQSTSIASFLVTLKQNAPAPAPAWLDDPKLAAEGRTLVDRYGCFGCHEIKGMEFGKGKVGTELSSHGRKLVEEFDFGLKHVEFVEEGRFSRQGWISKKIKEPRFFDEGRYRKQIDRLKMPDFELSDDEVSAITTFILGNTGEEVHPSYKYKPNDRKAAELEGWRLVEKFNCTGCHQINGQGGYILSAYGEKPEERVFAPPVLKGEGQKVQPDWLVGFLKAPVRLRPFLQIKMPTFDMSEYEAMALAKFFAAIDGAEYPFHHTEPKKWTVDEIAGTKKIFDTLQCLRCHQAGEEELTPEEAATKAPDLFLAARRLKPDWVVRWLHDPDAIQADTRMPNFWQNGQSMIPDVFGGDSEKQMEALSDFVMHLRENGVTPTPPTTGGAKKSESFYDDEEEEETPKPAAGAEPAPAGGAPAVAPSPAAAPPAPEAPAPPAATPAPPASGATPTKPDEPPAAAPAAPVSSAPAGPATPETPASPAAAPPTASPAPPSNPTTGH